MPEPPATPAVRAREAEQAAFQACMTTDSGLYVPNEEMWHRLAAYRDAVAARVTADLLASGTPLWVATDAGLNASWLFRSKPLRLDGGFYVHADAGDDGLLLYSQPALTPPGTVHQAVLLMKPEE